ncbi:MAG: flavin reductase family protein [Gemmatales bacterium]|nr:flavin reductase family protein [Gemmatales bacterium]MDW8386667.1 flavin reductase family protein [Gemmatales bacterium]
MVTEPRLAALGRVPSGIFIVTACHQNRETGMLASWIQQCSFDPPLISMAVKRGRFLASWLEEGCPFTVHILDESQTDLISHFGRGFAPEEDAFSGLEVRRRSEAAPILNECLAYLDCMVRDSHPTGDHTLFIAEVVDGNLLNSGRPMVHVRKSAAHY